MKIGAVMFFTADSMHPAALGRALEERGFESLWVPEHTHIPSALGSAYPATGGLQQAYYEIMDPFWRSIRQPLPRPNSRSAPALRW